MAVNAVERHAAPRANWLRLLAPNPERLEFATRLALICSLTTLVTGIYQTPYPALAAYLPFFYNRPERTVSLILSVAFTLIIAVTIGLVFLVANIVVDDAMWRVISIAVASFCLMFLGSASKLRPIAGSVALVVGYALVELGTIQTGELATRALLYLELCVAIPAGVSLLVNLVLAPAPRRTVEQAIADRLKLCAAVLRGDEDSVGRELAAKVRDGVAPILIQLKLAGIEKSAPARDLGVLQQSVLSCFALMSAVDALTSSPEVELSGAVRMNLADTLEQMARRVQRGEYPVGVTLELPPEAANLSPLARELLAAIRDAITRFAAPEAPAPTPPGKKEGFLVADAFTNPEHVYYALKTTAAAVFCYVLYSLLDWPGIHTCFITCYIVAQTTAAESVEKLSLRLIGCLIGAAAGYAAIVFLIPALTSIGGLMIAVFVGGWAGAYVAAGTPRISYAGFQLAFAFFLCIIQGSGPALDLTIARDRIIGLIVGNLVAYFAFAYVWPATITRRVDPALVTAFRQLAKVVAAKGPRERRLLASQAHGTLREVETDIELAQYEPASIRSPPAWLAARRAAVEQSQSLANLLLLSTDSRSRSDTGTRLEQLATRLAEPSATAPLAASAMQAAPGPQTLSAQLNQRLGALENTLVPELRSAEVQAHEPA
jgi:multidrug resistance protein MdtO